MDSPSPVYRCRSCGASSYQRLVHRSTDGVMRYSGILKCSGCSLEFIQLSSWRERRLRPRDTQAQPASAGEQPNAAPV